MDGWMMFNRCAPDVTEKTRKSWLAGHSATERLYMSTPQDNRRQKALGRSECTDRQTDTDVQQRKGRHQRDTWHGPSEGRFGDESSGHE
mmetsp:Transcript_16117/g.38499  ORF Transcript_16117/g.38499 Transcript_16117/m.38499 type:complete len:89 (-) Transcript_16117:1503-1769(-)